MDHQKQNKIWACLLHLSFNMWEEYISPHRTFRGFRSDLELDEPLWRDTVQAIAKNGGNMIVIDVGDAVKYDSHPEIAVNHAWSTKKMREELKKMRDLGIEPIPKLNFSAGHDTWMREYSRMVSTDKYYEVCANLIKEVCDLFDKPRFFHLGMDEETYSHQRYQRHIVVRQNDVWWNDFLYLVGQVEKNESRAWIWPDYMLWNNPEQFFDKMPKSVVQCNWYYGTFENVEQKYIQAYIDLNKGGYEQIPTGAYLIGKWWPNASTKDSASNIGSTVDFCKKNLEDKLLLGFLQTWWGPTIEENRDRIMGGIQLLGEAKKRHYR